MEILHVCSKLTFHFIILDTTGGVFRAILENRRDYKVLVWMFHVGKNGQG